METVAHVQQAVFLFLSNKEKTPFVAEGEGPENGATPLFACGEKVKP